MDKFQLDANLLIAEYQRKLDETTRELILQKAIVKQLQKELESKKTSENSK
jgi:hypothetical protein